MYLKQLNKLRSEYYIKTILIVEDDKNINEMLQEILKTNG